MPTAVERFALTTAQGQVIQFTFGARLNVLSGQLATKVVPRTITKVTISWGDTPSGEAYSDQWGALIGLLRPYMAGSVQFFVAGLNLGPAMRADFSRAAGRPVTQAVGV